MAPCIPTYRPTFTATRLAVTVAVLAMASSIYLVSSAPPAMAAAATTVELCVRPASS